MKAKNLPADLIHAWAANHAAANAKLEGRELPKDYVRSLGVEEFLARVHAKTLAPAPLHERLKMEARWG